jgi:hypothetical protein
LKEKFLLGSEALAMVQNRRTRIIGEILTVVGHDIEVVRSCTYFGAAINNTSDETQEIRARILVANKVRSCLQTVFRFKQIHINNNIK